jgi:2,3-bisphosphoglycerate-independent phosphoglycerate mutase
MGKKAALIILDGWGLGNKDISDGVHQAKTPFFDELSKNNPNSVLKTFGENVGLPKGQMGNSEVGHLNIGAGRIVFQDLLRIDNAISDKSFFKNPQLLKLINEANESKKRIHLLGLVSKGGVHSSLNHLLAICDMLKASTTSPIFIHGITDGRDCSPKSGLPAFDELSSNIEGSNIKIASIIGRYFAMDRDQRWDRIKLAYDLIVKGLGSLKKDYKSAFIDSYNNEITDEFIKPVKIEEVEGEIKEDDIIICFNFRTDRCRQITTALTQKDFPSFNMSSISLSYYTMTNYDKSFKKVNVIYDKDNLPMTLGEVLSNSSKTQLRIAETEKYPHVTYFFSGGREKEFDGESRLMASSPKVATYDLQPEMSANEITNKAISYVSSDHPDFLCLNYANPDMVGHTGIPKAIIKACETVDECLKKLVEKLKKNNYSIVIIADHGNADKMLNEDGSAHTAHTVNLVPVIVLDNNIESISNGILADVATTILDLMDLKQPKEMTGKSLLKKLN